MKCALATQSVGENQTVLRLKHFAEVQLTGLTFKFKKKLKSKSLIRLHIDKQLLF